MRARWEPTDQMSRGESSLKGALQLLPSSAEGGPTSPLRTFPHHDDLRYAWNYQAECYSLLCESCLYEFAAWWDGGFAVCPRCHGGGR